MFRPNHLCAKPSPPLLFPPSPPLLHPTPSHRANKRGDGGLFEKVVAKERPDIEKRKTQLLLRMAEDKKQLSDLEARILYLLSNSSGNILDDEASVCARVRACAYVLDSAYLVSCSSSSSAYSPVSS